MDKIVASVGPYKLSKVDINSAYFKPLFKFFKSWKFLSFPIFIGFLTGSGQGLYYNSFTIFLLYMFGSALSFILLIFIVSLVLTRIHIENFAKNVIKYETKLSLTENHLNLFQNENSESIAWKNIVSIKEENSFISITTKANNAFIIPKRVFESEDLQKLFIASTEMFIAKSRNDK